MNFEFKSYIPTPGEKHLGIAEVKAYGKFLLRYKIIAKKEGNGIFPATASLKITEMGQERYVSAFTLDSNSDKEECEGIVIANVRRYMQQAQGSPQMTQNANVGYQPIPSYPQPQIPQPSPFGSMHPFVPQQNQQPFIPQGDNVPF